MTRIGLPIDVVVIHRADHVTIEKCRIDWICFETGNKRGGFAIALTRRAVVFLCHSEPFGFAQGRLLSRGISGTRLFTCHRAMMLEQNLGVLLLTPSKRAADGV